MVVVEVVEVVVVLEVVVVVVLMCVGGRGCVVWRLVLQTGLELTDELGGWWWVVVSGSW